jgi:septum formation protein
MTHLILASQSPQRLQLLQEAGYDISVLAIDYQEPPFHDFPTAESYALGTAMLKASLAAQYAGNEIFLSADTIVVVENHILGKPTNRQHAQQMIMQLSGAEHQVLTAVVVGRLPGPLFLSTFEKTTLRMTPLTPEQVQSYLNENHWQNKAGGYAFQKIKDPYVQIVKGSVSNVIGLPVTQVGQLLEKLKSIE